MGGSKAGSKRPENRRGKTRGKRKLRTQNRSGVVHGVRFVSACIALSNSNSHINLLNITHYRWLICAKLRQ